MDNAKNFKGSVTAKERRQGSRHTLSATAEVVEIVSGARLFTRAADLSQMGCYLDTLNPFAMGTKVRVRIRWDGSELICAAEVRDSQVGMGMGVAFTGLDDAQKSLLQIWIQKLVSPPPADLSPSPQAVNAAPAAALPKEKEALAVRLIELLQKKGMLSANDVAALLRDRIL